MVVVCAFCQQDPSASACEMNNFQQNCTKLPIHLAVECIQFFEEQDLLCCNEQMAK
jgi:hypothetical protein